MDKTKIALELTLAALKTFGFSKTSSAEEYGKNVGELYNAILNSIECDSNVPTIIDDI